MSGNYTFLYKQRMELNNSDGISVNLFDTYAPNDVFEKHTLIIDWKQSIMFIMLRYIPDKKHSAFESM